MIKFNKNTKYIKIYKHGEQPIKKNIIKLNTNENPFNPTIKILKNLIKEIKFIGNTLKFYPDPESNKIKYIISLYYNINFNEVFIGNGSDEILAHCFLTFFKNKEKLFIQNITYLFYESYIKLYNIKYIIINLNKKFKIIKNIYKKIKGNILITNPNAPTGKIINNWSIEKIILNNYNSFILIDEAYIDFEKKYELVKLIKKYKNIIIIKTLSKSRSLAGLRIGYALSNIKIIKNLEKIKNSFNTYPINILNQKILNSLYINNIQFIKKIKIINKNKSFLIKNLKKINFYIINSKSNFLLIKNKKENINILIKKIKKYNFFLRKFEIPKIENFARLTITSKNNCRILIKILKNLNKF